MNIADKIKLVRTTKGLTQTEFANAIGLSRGNIANLELGNAKPTQLFINCVSLTFGVDKEWLTNDEDDSLEGLNNSKNIPCLISEKYDQLDDKYKEFVFNQIQQLLAMQDGSKGK
ncbi:helix-turn-helix transcriptional regulator [Clostridium botulinum]|nr:helix-turn-helix transcriptional regulator [Clostridium botulinum]NFP30056.1 helix-turn-helix transcriptional regulator [Clostridium botulinum]